MKLSDAMSQYLSGLSTSLSTHGHQELHRFGRWIGWERHVIDMAPPEVARYAEKVVAAGGDTHGRLTPLKDFLTFLKGRGELAHSLAPHVKIPRASKVAAIRFQAAADAIQMTSQGHESLVQELQELKDQRVPIIESIRLAAADKDFKENAPLDAAREAQGKLESRVRELEETLRRAVIADGVHQSADGSAQVGCRVVLRELTSGKEVKYLLVDTMESDPLGGKISVVSPVGQAVVGRYPGDHVEVEAPRGMLRYQVTSVER